MSAIKAISWQGLISECYSHQILQLQYSLCDCLCNLCNKLMYRVDETKQCQHYSCSNRCFHLNNIKSDNLSKFTLAKIPALNKTIPSVITCYTYVVLEEWRTAEAFCEQHLVDTFSHKQKSNLNFKKLI